MNGSQVAQPFNGAVQVCAGYDDRGGGALGRWRFALADGSASEPKGNEEGRMSNAE
jgi:hypothetical protein